MNNGADCPRCLEWTFDEEPCQSMECRGFREGIAAERARIVAWLRAQTERHRADLRANPRLGELLEGPIYIGGVIADAIESGKHEDK